jgi:thioesterase domain-containing protein
MAFEMARQLRQAGHEVGMLALIDGDLKVPGPPISKPLKYARIAIRKLCKIVFKFRNEVAEGPKQFVGKRLRYLSLSWRIRRFRKSSAGTADELTVEQTLMLAEDAYRPQPYAGSAFLLRFHDEAWTCGPDPLLGWGALVRGGLDVADFPGSHIRGMSPEAAPQLAGILKTQMLNAEMAFARKRRSSMMRAEAK